MAGIRKRNRSWWIKALLILTTIGVAGALGLWWLYFSAKRDWENHKSALEAQGESLDWRDFIAEPLPDEDNLAAATIMDRKTLRNLDPLQSLPGMKPPKGFKGWKYAEAYPFHRVYQPDPSSDYC